MRRRGFTLIEMMVVIAIIAILVAILLPVVSHLKQQGKSHRARAQLRSLRSALTAYHQAYDRWPGQRLDSGDGTYLFDDPEVGGVWSNDNDEVMAYLMPGHSENYKKNLFWPHGPGVVKDLWGDVLTISLSDNEMSVSSENVTE